MSEETERKRRERMGWKAGRGLREREGESRGLLLESRFFDLKKREKE